MLDGVTMGNTFTDEHQWFAVRMKPGRRSVHVGARYEVVKSRTAGKVKRRVKGTGTRMMASEVLLRRAGFDVFIPVREVWRRENRFSKEKRLVTYPMLGDWVFVGWPTGRFNWFDLMRLDVVAGVMGTGGRPVQVSSAQVARLMKRWGSKGLTPSEHQFMRTHAEFAVGDVVKIVDGPLIGEEVRVVDINGPAVSAVLSALGGAFKVEVRTDALERRA